MGRRRSSERTFVLAELRSPPRHSCPSPRPRSPAVNPIRDGQISRRESIYGIGCPVCDRDLRRQRRPLQAQARARHLRAAARGAAGRQVRPGRLLPLAHERRGVPQGLPGGHHQERPPQAGGRGDVEEDGAEHLLRGRQLRLGRRPRQARRQAGRTGQVPRDRRQPPVLHLHPAQRLRADHHPPRRARAEARERRRLQPADHREALRPRPGQRPGSEQAALHLLARGPGLPDRPLPRQGDGAEPDGDAVRQLDLRAALEPQVHRPRADHRQRDAQRRRPGRLLRHAAARPAT